MAISPIVGGAALKGPADRLLRDLGHEPSVVGIARWYAPVAATLVIDVEDAAQADAVEAEGVRCVVTDTIMRSPEVSADLAATSISAARRVRSLRMDLEVFGVEGIPEISPGTDLAGLRRAAASSEADRPLQDRDVVVVTQKIVSKAEGAMAAVDPDDPLSHKPLVEANRCGYFVDGAT